MSVDLPAFGKPDEPDIREQLQLEPEILDFARLTRLHLARRRDWWRSRNARCPRPPRPPLRDEHPLAFVPRDRRAAVLRLVRIVRLLVDQRADGNRQARDRARAARCGSSPAVVAALGGELRMEPIVDEGVGVRAGDDVDRAAVTAVAAARAAARHELLAPEREASAASVAGRDVNVDLRQRT